MYLQRKLNNDYGEAIHVFKKAPLKLWHISILGALAVFMPITLLTRFEQYTNFELWLGIGFELILIAALTRVYFFNTEEVLYIIFEKGLWRHNGTFHDRFLYWEEIQDVQIRTIRYKTFNEYTYISIITYDLEDRWDRLPIYKKLLWLLDKIKLGSHLSLNVKPCLDIEAEEMLNLIKSRIK